MKIEITSRGNYEVRIIPENDREARYIKHCILERIEFDCRPTYVIWIDNTTYAGRTLKNLTSDRAPATAGGGRQV